jgi:hypothetical protein
MVRNTVPADVQGAKVVWFLFVCLACFFGGTGAGAQGLALLRQVLLL